MASKSNRQRRLERARAERRLARQAHRVRRKRQIQAGVGAGLALVLIIFLATWIFGGFDSDPPAPVATDTCTWEPKDAAANPNVIDVGTPPPSGELRSGFETMTIETNLGTIEVLMDLSKIPCTGASFDFLGEKGFFAGSTCHRLNTASKTLTCGDPKSDGSGGPAYEFADEDIPAEPLADPSAAPSPSASAPPTYYAKGTVVMVNTGADTNGSQFTIIYGDGSDLTGAYSVVGTVAKGLEIVEGVAQAGVAETGGTSVTEGKPSKDMTIQRLYVGAAPEADPSALAIDPTVAVGLPDTVDEPPELNPSTRGARQ